ncbi:MAG: diguanylate cyclase domain-containing protein, partial [Terriglobia bacterium]
SVDPAAPARGVGRRPASCSLSLGWPRTEGPYNMADLERHLEKAEKYASKGKFDAALQEYKAAYQLAPKDLNLLQTIADLSVRAGKSDQALAHYGQLFDKYAEKMDAARGVPLFRKSLQGAPQPPGRYLKLGILLRRSRKSDEAAEAFRSAFDLFRQAGQTEGVLEAVQRLAELEPENPDTQVLFAEEANKAGKADLASKAFLRAGQLLHPENPDRALELLTRAYELTPERSTALSLARAHADKGNQKQAAELLMPLYAESEQDPAVLDSLSTALLAENRLQEAEEVIEAFYQAQPDTYEKLFVLADRYCQAGQPERTVGVMQRVKERLVAAKREKAFLERLEKLYKDNQSSLPLAEFAAATFNEMNQESRYGDVLDTLFNLYFQAGQFDRAADALERLIDIDPYDFNNSKRLEQIKDKVDAARFRSVSSRITAGATVSGQAAVFSPTEEKLEAAPVTDPQQRAALLEDYVVQAEIFLQYSLKAKAIEKLQKIFEMFPGEESRNERLYNLFQQAQYFPEGFGSPPQPGGAPAAPATAPGPAPSSADNVSDLAKIAEISHAIYRQSAAKSVLHTAVSELGKYLQASRCLGTLGRPGRPPSTAVEWCAPGVPQSPGTTVVKLLNLLGQRELDPENGTVLDLNLTPELKQAGAQSVLAMPLIDKEKQEPVGLIILSQADRPRQWKPNQVYLLRAVADQAETAISHGKLRSLMKSLSVADDATGLLGRSSYLDCLVSEVTRAKAQGTPLVVALLEIDKGSALLRQVGEASMQKFMQQAGETVLSSVRQNDLAIRYTATSLAVLLSDTTAQKCQPLLEKLRKKLSALKLPGGKDSLTFSAGVSEAAVRPDYDPLDIVTDVINRAEFSLEEARKKGSAVVVR